MKFTLTLIAALSLSSAFPLTAAEPEKAAEVKQPQGLQFDGKSSYVTFPHIKLEDYGEFTIEAWVKDWSGESAAREKRGTRKTASGFPFVPISIPQVGKVITAQITPFPSIPIRLKAGIILRWSTLNYNSRFI